MFLNIKISDISVSLIKGVITTHFISSVSNTFSSDSLSGLCRYKMLQVVYICMSYCSKLNTSWYYFKKFLKRIKLANAVSLFICNQIPFFQKWTTGSFSMFSSIIIFSDISSFQSYWVSTLIEEFLNSLGEKAEIDKIIDLLLRENWKIKWSQWLP